MSPRALTSLVVRLALATGLLMVCCTLGLPLLAALPSGVEAKPPLWGFIGPLVGGVMALVLLLLRSMALGRGDSPDHAANLPGQIVLLFLIGAVTGLVVTAVFEADPVMTHRPVAVLICGPALVLGAVLILRALVYSPLLVELTRLTGLPHAATPRKPRITSVGVLAIRPSLTLAAASLVAVALALVGGHSYCVAQHHREQAAERYLDDLRQVAAAELSRLPAWRGERLIASFPSTTDGTVVLLDGESRVLTERPGLPAQTLLVVDSQRRRCRVGRVAFRCSARAGLAAIDPVSLTSVHPALSSLASRLGLLALGFFIVAVLLGSGIGLDISRDFHVITDQLRGMAHQRNLDLGRRVTVTSIDEVGDLTEALGQIRTRLEAELADHQHSLRQVREADRMKNEFFSTISQELRTPLTTLTGYTQLLLDGSEGEMSAEQQRDLTSIENGAHQLLGLISDVLDLSIIEAGTLQLSREPVDLGALCRELVHSQRHAGEEDQPVQLELRIDDDLPTLEADPRRMTQVVQNLLSNALKFTEVGKVTVRVTRHGDGVRLQVEDTGIGISPGDLAQVFDSYRQAGELTARRQGSGLGLAIAKHLVEKHGGSITVESEVDLGSTFTVTLPGGGA